MTWPWGEAARQRRRADWLHIRCETLEGQLQESRRQRERIETETRRQRAALEQVIDNALFAAGSAPIFEPGAARFRTRTPEQQRPGPPQDAPLTPAEWRARIERLDAEAAERDRRARLSEELRKIAEETKHG